MAETPQKDTRLEKDPAAALAAAAVAGDLAGLQRLAAEGASLQVQQGNGLLIETARQGHTECLRWLLAQGADASYQSGKGVTALIWAAHRGDAEAVKLLLQNGAIRSTRDKKSKTAADYARSAGHTAVVALLSKDPDEISWYETVDDRAMQEVFNFRLKERITLIRKQEGGAVEAVTRQSFSALDDLSPLRKAFDAYRRSGGRITEDEVFPGTLLKAKPLRKLEAGK